MASAPSSPKGRRPVHHQRLLTYPMNTKETETLQSKMGMLSTSTKNVFYEIKVSQCLGQGQQGSVYPMREQPFVVRVADDWPKAVKLVDMYKRLSARIAYLAECRIYKVLRQFAPHPNIVHYFTHGMIGRHVGMIVMERLPPLTLTAYTEVHGTMAASDALHIMDQLASAVRYLHRCNISPRDIKADNISVEMETLRIKLFDFGLALDVSPPYGRRTTAQTGTQYFMAPEALHGLQHDTFLADMWCVGQVLYGLLTAERMFGCCETTEELKAMNYPNQKDMPPGPEEDFDTLADEQCFTLMTCLCDPCTDTRWTSKKLVSYMQRVQEGSPRDRN